MRTALRLSAAVALALLFVPTNAVAQLIYFAYARGEARFETHDRIYARLPRDAALSRVQRWIRENTAADAVIVDNPAVRQSLLGQTQHNEMPFFTGRALYTERRFYLTERHETLDERLALCRELFSTSPLGPERMRRLDDLGRPVYVLVRWPTRNERAREGARSALASIRAQTAFLPVAGEDGAWLFEYRRPAAR